MNITWEPPLSAEEERRLLQEFQAGSKAAGDKLTRAHVKYITFMIKAYLRYASRDDLYAEALLGFTVAMRRFNRFEPNNQVRLFTYARWWIRSYVLTHIVKNWSAVNTGFATKDFFKWRRLAASVRERQRDPNTLTSAELEMVRRVGHRDQNLKEPFTEGPGLEIDTTPSHGLGPEELLFQALDIHLVRDRLDSALAELDPRERFIIEKRLLAVEGEHLTFEEVGQHLGVSRERVRQIETRAKDKMRAVLDAAP